MLWLKRIICGIVALIFIFIGARLIHGGEQVWQAIGFCILVGGITLAHIAIVQQLPKYNFWITLTAAGLAYALYSTHNETLGQEKEIIDAMSVCSALTRLIMTRFVQMPTEVHTTAEKKPHHGFGAG